MFPPCPLAHARVHLRARLVILVQPRGIRASLMAEGPHPRSDALATPAHSHVATCALTANQSIRHPVQCAIHSHTTCRYAVVLCWLSAGLALIYCQACGRASGEAWQVA
jgi:hypothetical protein